MTGATNYINAVVFGPGGHTLLAGVGDFTVRVWNLDADSVAQDVCADTTNVLTAAQWRQYVPELPFEPRCGTGR